MILYCKPNTTFFSWFTYGFYKNAATAKVVYWFSPSRSCCGNLFVIRSTATWTHIWSCNKGLLGNFKSTIMLADRDTGLCLPGSLSYFRFELLTGLCLHYNLFRLQRHLQHLENGSRAGFFIGDGAGVGKGRTIAGLIWENWQHGRRKAL